MKYQSWIGTLAVSLPIALGALYAQGATHDIDIVNYSSSQWLNHIHGPASATQTASVLINLAPYNGGAFGVSGGTAGTVTLTPDNLGYVIDGRTYVNYHTAANGSGEIRGQVVR